MRKIIIVFILFSSTVVLAQTKNQNKIQSKNIQSQSQVKNQQQIVNSQSKNSNESIDHSKQQTKNETFPAFEEPTAQKEINLRPRNNNIILIGTSVSTTLKFSSSESKSINQKFVAGYSRNFGYIQSGIGVGILKTQDDDGTRTYTAEVLPSVRFNFIKNNPGNNIIPFAGFGLDIENIKITQNSNDSTISGTPFEYGAGIDWYPFNELIALQVKYVVESGDITYNDDSQSTNINFEANGISVAFVLSF